MFVPEYFVTRADMRNPDHHDQLKEMYSMSFALMRVSEIRRIYSLKNDIALKL